MKELKPDCFEDIIAGYLYFDRVRWTRCLKYKQNRKIRFTSKLEPILKMTMAALFIRAGHAVVRELAGLSYSRSVRFGGRWQKNGCVEEERRYFIMERRIGINIEIQAV